MTRFRPRASASSDEKGETRRAKRAVEEVMMDLSVDVRSLPERALPMDTRVAETTPVSSNPRHRQRTKFPSFTKPHAKECCEERAEGEARNVQPKSNPLIPAEKVSSSTNTPGAGSGWRLVLLAVSVASSASYSSSFSTAAAVES